MAKYPHTHHDRDTEDVPFMRNDMKNQPATMEKPLDTADGPGKADAELAQDEVFRSDKNSGPGSR